MVAGSIPKLFFLHFFAASTICNTPFTSAFLVAEKMLLRMLTVGSDISEKLYLFASSILNFLVTNGVKQTSLFLKVLVLVSKCDCCDLKMI